jgi:hypothetical protein
MFRSLVLSAESVITLMVSFYAPEFTLSYAWSKIFRINTFLQPSHGFSWQGQADLSSQYLARHYKLRYVNTVHTASGAESRTSYS